MQQTEIIKHSKQIFINSTQNQLKFHNFYSIRQIETSEIRNTHTQELKKGFHRIQECVWTRSKYTGHPARMG